MKMGYLALLLSIFLLGCGQRGPLYLPPAHTNAVPQNQVEK